MTLPIPYMVGRFEFIDGYPLLTVVGAFPINSECQCPSEVLLVLLKGEKPEHFYWTLKIGGNDLEKLVKIGKKSNQSLFWSNQIRAKRSLDEIVQEYVQKLPV